MTTAMMMMMIAFGYGRLGIKSLQTSRRLVNQTAADGTCKISSKSTSSQQKKETLPSKNVMFNVFFSI